jgi:hypothetical protein
MSSKGIEPFLALTNSFTENHHYQSDHLPYLIHPALKFKLLRFYIYIFNLKKYKLQV